MLYFRLDVEDCVGEYSEARENTTTDSVNEKDIFHVLQGTNWLVGRDAPRMLKVARWSPKDTTGSSLVRLKGSCDRGTL